MPALSQTAKPACAVSGLISPASLLGHSPAVVLDAACAIELAASAHFRRDGSGNDAEGRSDRYEKLNTGSEGAIQRSSGGPRAANNI